MTLRIIGGTFKGRSLKTPKGETTRPTTAMAREALFNRCQHLIEGAVVLDLFAGSGAIGFEALSRGAAHVTFVEKDRAASTCIRQNQALLELEGKCTLLQMDAHAALSRLKHPFDLIYVDPPYDLKVASLLEEIGKNHLLKSDGILFFEERYRNKTPPQLLHLKYVDSRKYGEASIHQYQRVLHD